MTTKSEISGVVVGGISESAQIHFLHRDQFDVQRASSSGAALAQNFSLSWIVTTLEAVAVVLLSLACGVIYHQIEYGYMRNPLMFVSTGLVVALLYCTGMRSVAELSISRIGTLSYAYLVWTCVFLVLSFFAFTIKATETLSRGAILSFYVLGFAGAACVRVTVPRLLARYHGHLPRRDCLVIGADGNAGIADVIRSLRLGGHGSATRLTIDGLLDEMQWRENLASLVRQVLNRVRGDNHGEIYVVASGFRPARLSALLGALQTVPRAVRLVPEADVEQLLNFPLRRVGHSCVVELQREPLSSSQRLVKRCLDLAIAVPLLIFIAPLMLVIALLVKMDSPGPVFFRQTRLGAWGQPFRILKFRSMNVMEDGGKIVQASRGDQRVTRIGRILRKTSLDELPQLFNVLKGEMSLVGPRPHAVAHDKLYSGLIENYELRQLVKPGITGWAQINGYRGETTTTDLMRKRVQHDLWYAKNANPALDVMILAKTAFVLFGQSDAY
ncbi:MAG TPA: exopolysaccharide biosynthesis polyprenyl glycosylphosphotransferase [Rhizomicrobium sp.]|nr:exopolysaccharide biosynthesis polyprenyl glycosylphosphotransferase [Rhizomicrobium sp.]